jgi:hypothetical protein
MSTVQLGRLELRTTVVASRLQVARAELLGSSAITSRLQVGRAEFKTTAPLQAAVVGGDRVDLAAFSTVQLDGRASTAGVGGILAYEWSTGAGSAPVVIPRPGDPVISLVVPGGLSAQTVIIRLRVQDASSWSGYATINLTVRPASQYMAVGTTWYPVHEFML